MKKTNLAKKGLMPAVLGAVCSVVALTSVSYAWFTMGNSGEVENIQVNVQSADGMQLSVNALDWKSYIDTDDLANVETNKMLSDTTNVMPISSNGVVSNGALKFYEGKLDADGSTVLAKLYDEGKTDESNYVMFDLYVKLDNAKNLQLATGSKIDSVDGGEIHLATRAAFIDLGSTTGTPANALALDGSDTTASTTPFIWEPNATEHTVAAKLKLSSEQQNAVLPYEGISGYEENAIEQAGYKKAALSSVTKNATNVDQDTQILSLEAGINKVRVYIWVEGQDVDCLNDVSGQSFLTTLKFSVPTEAQ